MHSQLEEHIFMKELNTLVQTKLLLELKFNFPTNLWGALCLHFQPNKSFQFRRTTEFELHKVLFSHSANNKFPTFLTILPLVIITKIKILFYLQLKLVQIFVSALSPMTDCLTSPTFSFNPKPSDTFHIHLVSINQFYQPDLPSLDIFPDFMFSSLLMLSTTIPPTTTPSNKY